MFVKGDTAAAVTLRLISRQPAMSPTGFSDPHRDGSGCVAAFDNCGKSNKAWGSEKHTKLAGFSRNTDRVFVTGDTAAAVTLRLISRQPAMSPTGFSDSHRDGSGCVAAFDNCGKSTKAWGSEKHTELAGFSRNTDRVFVTGDTAAAVTLRLISRQPAMSPTGFSDSHRDGSGWVADFDKCG